MLFTIGPQLSTFPATFPYLLCISGIIATFEKVVLLDTVTDVLSTDPFLVVISTTPAAAALPYNAAAEGPVSIEIDSISSGLISAAPSVPGWSAKTLCELPPFIILYMGTPSIT